jgi:hypothetical protein
MSMLVDSVMAAPLGMACRGEPACRERTIPSRDNVRVRLLQHHSWLTTASSVAYISIIKQYAVEGGACQSRQHMLCLAAFPAAQ